MSKSSNPVFTRILAFKYKNKTYEMFQDRNYKLAFLEIDNTGNYHYPELAVFIDLARIFYTSRKHFFLDKSTKEKHRKVRFVPKIIISGVLIAITSLSLFKIIDGGSIFPEDYSDHYKTYATYYGLDTDRDYIEKEDYHLYKSAKSIRIFNTSSLDAFLGYSSVSVDSIKDAINSNMNIDEVYKPFICEFITTMNNYYGNLELRVFYENIKNVTIRRFTREEELLADSSTLAFYDPTENVIAVRDSISLTGDNYDSLTLRHELGHLFNNTQMKSMGHSITYDFCVANHGYYAEEAINCIFTANPYDYGKEQEDNIGYPLQRNIYQIIIDSLPNYNFADFTRSNITTLEEAMDEYMKDYCDARTITTLIATQANERLYEDGIQVEDTQYIDIYEYVTTLYIMNNITPDMSYEEIMKHKDYVITTLTRGIVGEKIFGTEEYDQTYIHVEVVDDLFNEYLTQNNITSHHY